MKKAWMNPQALRFYESLVRSGMRVLEFGAGHSTIWLDSLGCHVTSYEHNRRWFDTVYHELIGSDRSVVIHDKRYWETVGNQYGPEFDLVVVDGIERLKCVEAVITSECLAEGGWLVFDDSQRREDTEEYEKAWALLVETYGEPTIHFSAYSNQYKRWEASFFKN